MHFNKNTKIISINIENKKLTLEDQIKKIQHVYTFGIEEMAQIISKECTERGMVLKEIWNVHVNLVNAFLSKSEHEKNYSQMVYDKELEKIKNSNKISFEKLTLNVKELKSQITEKEYLLKKLNYDVVNLKKREAKSKHSIQTLVKLYLDLKDTFDTTLQENLKLKLSKEEEYNLKRGERDLLKRQYEEIIKKSNQDREKILAFTNVSLASISSKNFNVLNEKEMESTEPENTKGSLRKILSKKSINFKYDENDTLEDLQNLFFQNAETDTKDLNYAIEKETTTDGLRRYYLQDKNTQTLTIHEIEANANQENKYKIKISNSENREATVSTHLGSDEILQSKTENVNIEKSIKIQRKMFSFSNESYLEKIKNQANAKELSFYYSQDLKFILDTYGTDKTSPNDFREILEHIHINSEKFIQDTIYIDELKSKEILRRKIDHLEMKIEIEELDKINQLLKSNFEKMRIKFHELLNTVIQIEVKKEDKEFLSESAKNTDDLFLLPKKNQSVKKQRRGSFNVAPMNFIEKERDENLSPAHNSLISKNKNILISTEKLIGSSYFESNNIDDKWEKNENLENSVFLFPEPKSKRRTLGEDLKDQDSNNANEKTEKKQKQIWSPAKLEKKKKTVKIDEDSIEMKHTRNVSGLASIKVISEEKKEKLQDFEPPLRRTTTDGRTKKSENSGSNKNILSHTEELKKFLVRRDEEAKEILEKEKAEKDNSSHLDEKMINLINEANSMLPNKKKWARISYKNADKCSAFMTRIGVSTLSPSKKVSLHSISKLISQVYTEILKQYNDPNSFLNPLFFILYEYLSKKCDFSSQKTEKKIIKLFQGCLNNLHVPRVLFFAKLVGIIKESKLLANTYNNFYDGIDLTLYFQYFKMLDDNPLDNTGIMLAMSTNEHVYIGLNRAISVFKKYFNSYVENSESFVNQSKVEGIINQMMNAKVKDPVVFRKYIIDIDFVLEKIFEIRNETLANYQLPFVGVDLDLNDALNINEFILLLRNIENDKLKEKEIVDIFQQEYDFIDEEKNEECMSFKKFAIICHKRNLCSSQTLEEFMNKSSDHITNFEILQEEFALKKNLIKLKLIKTGFYSNFYNTLIKMIEKSLKNSNMDENEKRIRWFQYRIIDEEANALLLDYETQLCLPKELNLIFHL